MCRKKPTLLAFVVLHLCKILFYLTSFTLSRVHYQSIFLEIKAIKLLAISCCSLIDG